MDAWHHCTDRIGDLVDAHNELVPDAAHRLLQIAVYRKYGAKLQRPLPMLLRDPIEYVWDYMRAEVRRMYAARSHLPEPLAMEMNVLRASHALELTIAAMRGAQPAASVEERGWRRVDPAQPLSASNICLAES